MTRQITKYIVRVKDRNKNQNKGNLITKLDQNKDEILQKQEIWKNDELIVSLKKLITTKYQSKSFLESTKSNTYNLLKILLQYIERMRIEFVMKVDGVNIKVEASSYFGFYRGLPHMECVGYFSFDEVDSGQSLGSATRYYQDCQQIMLLAQTGDQIDLAYSALKWIQRHNSCAWERMNWNTTQVGRPQDFERHQESERQEEQSEQRNSESQVREEQSEQRHNPQYESKLGE